MLTQPLGFQPHGRFFAFVLLGSNYPAVLCYGDVIDSYNAFRAAAARFVALFALLAFGLTEFRVYLVDALIACARLTEFGLRAMLGFLPGRLLGLTLTEAAWFLERVWAAV